MVDEDLGTVRERCLQQRQELKGLDEMSLRPGDTWFLIDTKWFKQWKLYVGLDQWEQSMVGDPSACPGPIDNSPLLEVNNKLKEHLVEDSNFTLLPESLWNKLVEWYGMQDGQEPVSRRVIDLGVFSKNLKVEIYLVELHLSHMKEPEATTPKSFSQVDTVETIAKTMRQMFRVVDDKEIRLWLRYMSKSYEPLSKPELTIQESGLYTGQMIVIEEQNDDGTWPLQQKPSTSSVNNEYSSTSNSSSYESFVSKPICTPGLCGLSNLGNTCFMNSAIQCMSNVPALTDYMLSPQWKQELNKDNPLGMHGDVATTYAELIRMMWSGKCSSTVPRHFKTAVGRFKPEFSGYQQQDSQELMAFLLDGLHEDLNRIRKKPYIETKETDNRPDEDVAKETWQDYTKRNDSVIVDTFHGLLKSTLVCPQCSKVSVKFDPFCYLSVPLPVKKERQLEVFLVALDPSKKIRQCKVTVPKMGSVTDLCLAVSALASVPAENLVVADVYSHRFHKVFATHESLSHISDRDDIFVYEVPVTAPDDPETAIIPVYMREVRERHSVYAAGYSQLFGQPLLVPVPRNNCSYDVVYKCILQRLSRYVRVPNDNEWPLSSPESSLGSHDDIMDERSDENDGQSSDHHNRGERTDQCEDSDVTQRGDENDCELSRRSEEDKRIFSFTIVNSYGNTDIKQVRDDGHPIVLSNHCYLSADWCPKAKELFYDEKEAEMFDTDESMEQKILSKKVIHLTDCIDLFTTMERLGEQDPWYCPVCKKHQQATKKFDIWQLPNVIVFHLKRFSYSRYWRDKLDTFIDYPTRGLDMSKFVINPRHGPALYDLIAVSNHYGGMGGGHYTAYGKNRNGQWYSFDDSSVTTTSEESVVTKAGYVLVYQRRDIEDQVITPPQSQTQPQPQQTTGCRYATRSTKNNITCDGGGTATSRTDDTSIDSMTKDHPMDTN